MSQHKPKILTALIVMEDLIRLGISTCLLGEHVRYDGGHKLDRFLVETLGKYVEFVPVCPEVECGLGTPREAMHLEGDPITPRLVTIRTRQEHTERMISWAKKRVGELSEENLCGFIFKSNSPSSGMQGVKIYNPKRMPEKKGVGIFARAFMQHFPLLPVEDEGRLHDPGLRENFIERIFALKRWRDFLAGSPSMGKLVTFHTREKLLILSHSPKHYQILGRLVAQAKNISPKALYSQYETTYMEALRLKTTVKRTSMCCST